MKTRKNKVNSIKQENVTDLLCRICLDTVISEAAIDLFAEPRLAIKLSECTSLCVEPQDGGPKSICKGCFTRLNDLYDFRELCIDSAKRFQEKTAKNEEALSSHRNVEALDEKPNIEVQTNSDQHFDPLLNHELLSNQSANESEGEPDDKFTSDMDDDALDEPLMQKIPKTNKKCNVNDYKASPKSKHIPAAKHQSDRMHKCHICQQKFLKVHCYDKHMKYHNKDLPYQCPVETCRKGFTTRNGLFRHDQYVHAAKWLPCPVQDCGCTCYNAIKLKSHLKVVHKFEEEIFSCNFCSFSHRNEQTLRKHVMVVHENIKDYMCQYCGKTFGLKSTCKIHEKTHTDTTYS